MASNNHPSATPIKRTRPCNKCGEVFTQHTNRMKYACGKCRHDKDYSRNYRLKSKYGITVDQYDAMLAAQGGGCGCCGTKQPGGHGAFHVDHDHRCCPTERTCGECVRSLVCARCNVGIAMFADDPERLLAAVLYLERVA